MPSLFAAILFALVALMTVIGADQPNSCSEINGNWYCSAVSAITYTNFGNAGTYREVTGMFEDGTCSSQLKNFNGPMAPLADEVSFHFRGPLVLKQFAVYIPTVVEKRNTKAGGHLPHHAHRRFHSYKKKFLDSVNHSHGHGKLKRLAEDEWVTATINSNTVSLESYYTPDGSLPTAITTAPNGWVTATINGDVVSWINVYGPGITSTTSSSDINQMGTVVATVSIPSSTTTSTPTPVNQMGTVVPVASPLPKTVVKVSGSTQWNRQAYYNAESQTAGGLVFLNNNGGQASGVFDYKFGASLSYASCDAKTGAASPQILANSMIDDNVEFIIFSDKECNDDCGYTRPGTVAYHGFDGASKAFFLEFSMPTTGKLGWDENMPAVWILNALIPRTLQYGEAECSCWESGCGEWDIFEILDSGNTRAKSTVHADVSGGESDYFDRPCDKTIKAAVVFDGEGNAGHIRILADDVEFGDAMSGETIAAFCGTEDATVFQLGA